MTTGWPPLLSALLRGEDLTPESTTWAMEQVMTGEATPAQVAGFALALRAKGETPAEVTGLVDSMLSHSPRVSVQGRAVDTCGSGGDGAHTVNISTMASLVVAGAGVTVVKHGNRAASSACGSADLLEELGVVIDLPPRKVEECVRSAGIAFCFAPVFHAGMRHAAGPRRELGVPTVFNFLGPLTNPAQPASQAVGVSDLRMAPVMAGVLAARGVSALVFRGDDGLDELTVTTTSTVWEVRDGEIVVSTLDPRDLGLELSSADSLRGADRAFNAAVTRRLLDGERGPVRDAVLLNAAAALTAWAPTAAGTLVERMQGALAQAAEVLDTGTASRLLDRWVSESVRLAGPRTS